MSLHLSRLADHSCQRNASPTTKTRSVSCKHNSDSNNAAAMPHQ